MLLLPHNVCYVVFSVSGALFFTSFKEILIFPEKKPNILICNANRTEVCAAILQAGSEQQYKKLKISVFFVVFDVFFDRSCAILRLG